MDDRGIIYVASQHPRFLCEAIASGMTVAEKLPGVPMTLFTDIPSLSGLVIEPFERIVALSGAASETDLPHGRAKLVKVRSFARSPYPRTIFLDTDTRVIGNDVASLFDELSTCDLAAVACTPKNSRSCALYGPMFNTGVVAFRRNDKTQSLFAAWESSLLFHLALVRSETANEVPYVARLDPESRAFLLTTDQLSFARTLSPERNVLGVDVKTLDDSWNARNRPPDRLEDVRIDHADRHKVDPRAVEHVLSSLGLASLCDASAGPPA